MIREILQNDDMDLSNLYLGLLHYPVYDRGGRVVCTAVTNLDIHDTARCAHTFGVRITYVINPLDSQRELVGRILRHWIEGPGAHYNPLRKRALEQIRVRATLGEVVREISEAHQMPVLTVATDASWQDNAIPYGKMRELLLDPPQPYLLVFGTGWGLTREVLEASDYVLAPIEGISDYNHLSLRAATAIILDRLMGDR